MYKHLSVALLVAIGLSSSACNKTSSLLAPSATPSCTPGVGCGIRLMNMVGTINSHLAGQWFVTGNQVGISNPAHGTIFITSTLTPTTPGAPVIQYIYISTGLDQSHNCAGKTPGQPCPSDSYEFAALDGTKNPQTLTAHIDELGFLLTIDSEGDTPTNVDAEVWFLADPK